MFFTEGSIHILVVKLKSAIRPLQENRVWGGFDSFSETFFFLVCSFSLFCCKLDWHTKSRHTRPPHPRWQKANCGLFCISHILLAWSQVWMLISQGRACIFIWWADFNTFHSCKFFLTIFLLPFASRFSWLVPSSIWVWSSSECPQRWRNVRESLKPLEFLPRSTAWINESKLAETN